MLEALERGWRDRLPEAAYLRTMVPLIERHLELPTGSLEMVLPSNGQPPQSQRREPLLRRFTPGSIYVFTTWQGTLLYGVLTLGLIYAMNLQQQQLAARGLLALRPIPLLPASEQDKPPRPDQALLQLYPELRPLELAARGQASASSRAAATGLLELKLTQPSRISLNLPLSGYYHLSLTPPPRAGDLMSWNGSPLLPVKGQLGQFRPPESVARP